MVCPFLDFPVAAWLWYQGEANANDPEGYARCFPQMISSWRQHWSVAGTSPKAPFEFVQLSSWPTSISVPTQRYAQMAALNLPAVGMAVSADIGDPASCMHPIHPPFKQEVARRMYFVTENLLYGNSSGAALNGPAPVSVTVDSYDKSWGTFHLGTLTNACSSFKCMGIRVKFNQPINIQQSYGLVHGMADAFVLESDGGTQPVTMNGLLDDYTLQLNVTGIYGNPKTLYYGWDNYPNMPLFNKFQQPVVPFNASLTA